MPITVTTSLAAVALLALCCTVGVVIALVSGVGVDPDWNPAMVIVAVLCAVLGFMTAAGAGLAASAGGGGRGRRGV